MIAKSGLFDTDWYLKSYPDVAVADMDPVQHYVAVGAAEGRSPGPCFDVAGYLAANPDVTAAGMNPLFHYVQHGEAEGRRIGASPREEIENDGPPPSDQPAVETSAEIEACTDIAESGIFDPDWYLRSYIDVAAAKIDPVQHYVTYGAAEGRNPGPSFDAGSYLAANPDVAASRLNPLLHYIRYGRAEGRRIGASPREEIENDGSPPSDQPSVETSLEIEACIDIAESGIFDPDWYLRSYIDVAAAEIDPVQHYVKYGAAEGRNPGPSFDAGSYLAANPDVAASRLNPLLHYIRYGRAEGRRMTSVPCDDEESRPPHPSGERAGKAKVDHAGIVLAGHPFSPSGMGEHIRSSLLAFQAAGLTPAVQDIFRLDGGPDSAVVDVDARHRVERLATGVNIFHVGGDEVERSVAHLSHGSPPRSYNVVYLAWALSRAPSAWAPPLERFDEIWTPSAFTCDAIASIVSRPVIHMRPPREVSLSSFLGRPHFGIPRSAYTFLSSFDLSSYPERENPFATIAAFTRLCAGRQLRDTRLVINTNTADARPIDRERFHAEIAALQGNVCVIDRTLSDNEAKNLIRCCDCFVSLHRASALGRWLSAAMYFGKPVIATGYSNTMDFTTEDNSYLVDFDLVPIARGQYLHSDGQIWADADVDQAAQCMRRLVDAPEEGRRRGTLASQHMRQFFSNRASGLRYRRRLEEIQATRGSRT